MVIVVLHEEVDLDVAIEVEHLCSEVNVNMIGVMGQAEVMN